MGRELVRMSKDDSYLFPVKDPHRKGRLFKFLWEVKTAEDWVREVEVEAYLSRMYLDDESYTMCCSHAHLAVEKAIKAVMKANDVAVTKENNLNVLCRDVQSRVPVSLVGIEESCFTLTGLATLAKHPGYLIGQREANSALTLMKFVLDYIRNLSAIGAIHAT